MKKQDDDNIGLGSIFRGLDKLINIVGDMLENEESEVDIKGALNDPEKSKKVTANYGVNIKIGGENFKGIKDINSFNKMKDSYNKEKIIEPATDVFDEEERVLIVMELPGVSEEDIKIEVESNILKIEAEVNNNIYIKNVKLSFVPITESITSQLNNSIYSIIINKTSEIK
ncbi:Hsp20 family protein [Clostridium sp. BL-8]|uniref:Hsp20/alpha crystallin family protein n=1 Tax=Clostridium sp. BL-8 TaxID=349938 RepID=UPI00098C8EEE|nr:Hsp20 family protein [Clostridium sp. BL-8]OOM77814.1 GvpH [Clostridium sp. BL-8]